MTIRNFCLTASFSLGLLAAASPAWAVCDATKPTKTPMSRYVIKGGEVYDKTSNLTWERCSVGQSWADSSGCTGTVLALPFDAAQKQGGKGWRVPSMVELSTLIAPTCHAPAVNDEAFPGMAPDKLAYWTSTSDDAELAWYLISFLDGEIYDARDYDTARAVRLVRTGP